MCACVCIVCVCVCVCVRERERERERERDRQTDRQTDYERMQINFGFTELLAVFNSLKHVSFQKTKLFHQSFYAA